MNATLVTLSAAGCGALSNIFFRKCNASANSFLICYYIVSFLWSFLINFNLLMETWNPIVLLIGGMAGILNVGMMFLTSQSLQRGPLGLTYAFQNASTVFPNIVLFLLFGSAFGFMVTHFQLVGMCILLIGLWWASRSGGGEQLTMTKGFLKYALGCFLVQTLILTIFQWRCLLFSCDIEHSLIPTTYLESEDVWFMPGFFGVAAVVQGYLFLRERKPITSTDITYGTLAGIANGTSTYFLLLATKLALPLEKGIIFPLFAVSVILICNFWGWKLYKERVNVIALILCALGILIASLGSL